MNDEILVKVEQISKKFCKDLQTSLWYGIKDLSSEFLGVHTKRNLRPKEFWAVKDISFELRRGECLGLIGHNGAGKSTLLKILNGLIKPDHGKVTIKGKVGALIELGAGFNPLLSGRENIYVNGQILGMTKKEIDEKLESIIDFAEIQDFIDSPVRNYSSGMKVRLGFAVATQMEPDVLIIDEVFAVGDIGFILKSLNVMDNLLSKTAVIFVSHSMPMVSRVCSQILLLEKGVEKYLDSDVSKGIDLYYSKFKNDNVTTFSTGEKVKLIKAEVGATENVEGSPMIEWLDDLRLNFIFQTEKNVSNPTISLFFLDKEQRPIGVCINNNVVETSRITNNGDTIIFETSILLRKIQLSMGLYSITFGLSEGANTHPILRVRGAIIFQVHSKRHVWQPFDFEGEWEKIDFNMI